MATKPGTRKPVITAAKRRRVVELAEAGKGRNDIARDTGIGLGTVSKIVREAGLSFDRSATRHATEAKKADNAARRAQLSSRLLDETTSLLDQMHSEHLVYSFGGKDNSYEQRTIPKPSAGDQRALMLAATAALQRHMDLERHDSDTKAGDAASMLTNLGKALGVQQPDSA